MAESAKSNALFSAAQNIRSLKSTRSLSELLPWAIALTRDVVLCKDGALLAGFVYDGLNTEGRSETELAADAALLERAYGSIASRRVMLWWTVRRDRVDGWVGGAFKDPLMQRANRAARNQWNQHRHYVTQRVLWVALSPSTPAETLMTRIASEGSAGFVKGLAPWLKGTLTGRTVFEAEASRLLGRLQELNALCQRVVERFPEIKARRLQGPHLWGWLNTLATPSLPWHPSDLRSGFQALDEVLGEDALSQDAGGMTFKGPTDTRYCAAITPKTVPDAWPQIFHPGILDDLFDLDAECVFSLAVRFYDPDAARKAVRERRMHLLNWQKGMSGYIKEGVAHIETENKDSEKEIQAVDADAALRDLVTTPAAALIFPVMYVRGRTPNDRDRAVSEAMRAFHIAGFNCIRERMHQVSAWAGTLPGQWGAPVRWTYASAAAIADISPIRGAAHGSPVNRHLTRSLGKRQPALATFSTRLREPYWLEPHLNDVGHGLILGPTGMGKSVFGGWMVMRWNLYPNARTYIFDKDRSLRKLVLLTGGQYLDTEAGLKINPFAGLETPADWTWAVDFVVSLLSWRDGDELPAADTQEVTMACRRVQSLPLKERRLRVLSALLPKRLSERLAQWVDRGRYAGYFDHETDSMDLSTSVAFAMDDVLRFPAAARAFMDIVFHRIAKRLDGTPTYIHIEEGWFLLNWPQFETKMDDWARTLRKLNGIQVISTQALNELSESRAFRGLVNAPNKFLLPNPDIYSSEGLYKDQMGLTNEQIKMIKEARPKSEVVLVREGRARVLSTRLPVEAVALLRVDASADEAFERWMKSGHPEWRKRYVDEMVEKEKAFADG